mmetsp:Transcript_61964/g.195864  ORF Transcript_61964/g.195864 Transcript_61964/m.195864 type:complete len:238 (-) Transcript_61964:186-899(-)
MVPPSPSLYTSSRILPWHGWATTSSTLSRTLSSSTSLPRTGPSATPATHCASTWTSSSPVAVTSPRSSTPPPWRSPRRKLRPLSPLSWSNASSFTCTAVGVAAGAGAATTPMAAAMMMTIARAAAAAAVPARWGARSSASSPATSLTPLSSFPISPLSTRETASWSQTSVWRSPPPRMRSPPAWRSPSRTSSPWIMIPSSPWTARRRPPVAAKAVTTTTSSPRASRRPASPVETSRA